jgi:hypothetical protein
VFWLPREARFERCCLGPLARGVVGAPTPAWHHQVIVRPAITEQAAAWRVSSFLLPAERPTARLTREVQTAEDTRRALMAAEAQGHDTLSVVPPGQYMCLSVLYDGNWWPVMMDTPSEYEDHADLFEHARGRVLLHGLGLGCALSALLADPAVEHVDVVEANADVISIVAPYYRGYPVTIHHASCIAKVWPEDVRWDYVWHDIWTEVTPDNLDDATAEHGISYGRLAEQFAGRADRQGAWAFDLVMYELYAG